MSCDCGCSCNCSTVIQKGDIGPQGPQGIQGIQGEQGEQGLQGEPGENGRTILSGITAPSVGLGDIGDFYINTATDEIYGPKSGGGWGSPTSLIGPEGPPGPSGGVLGLLQTSSTNQGITFFNAPFLSGVRSVRNGTTKTNFFTPNQSGTLVGTLNTTTGIWTPPAEGWYDFTLLFSLSIGDSPFNQLTASPPGNPNGFLGDPAEGIGEFAIALMTTDNGSIVCSNTQVVTVYTSHIIISATYNARKINADPITGLPSFKCVWLNKLSQEVVGQSGNSYHLTIKHIQ